MSLPFYIARRLYGDKNNSSRISTLGVNIATAGVAIGLAVMIISVAVVFGFKEEIKAKVIGFGSHIQIVNSDALQEPDAFPVVVTDSFVNRIKNCSGVKHIQRVSQKTGIIKTDNEFKGIVLKGVGADFDAGFISSHLIEGELPNFSSDESRDSIVISNIIATELQLKAGDKVFAYFFGDEVRMRRFLISGIYETNMAQFDNSVVLANVKTVNKLNGWGKNEFSNIEVTVLNFNQNEAVADMVANVKPSEPDVNGCFYSVYSIKELYGAIFEWLNLLDLNIWVILALMTCVCCFTMISGLFILILEKTSTIGILKALGARNRMIRRVFLHYGVFIVGRAFLIANVLSLLLCFIQWKWHVVTLDASSYYVDYVPVSFDWFAICLINVFTMLICTIILTAPILVISRVEPVKALKFD